ncbi:MAG TPA: hypothetical protein DCZ01_09720 [Elusimicrobia bacterium]|nr:hypothetical protein [Elusimicrobiota bacterium]
MANENENILQANLGAPAADIPDLKKKDKERKRGGAAWSGPRGAAGSWRGATGGVARAAAGLGEQAAPAGIAARIAQFLAGLGALGKLAVLAAVLAALGGALFGYAMLKTGVPGLGSPDMGAISSSMKVHSGGGDRLGVAGKGEIRFDPLPAAVPAKPQDKPAPEAEAQAPVEIDALQGAKAALEARGRLEHNLSGAKLSNTLGGQFGGKNIFAGASLAPKFGASMPKIAAQKGKLSGIKAKPVKSRASVRNVSKARTSRSIGQLKMAKGMSLLGAQAGSGESAASNAQGAFDQSKTDGGALTAAADGQTVSTDGGTSGAPDVSMPETPETPETYAYDSDLQSAMDAISKMADNARKMKQQGQMMMMAGAALIAEGVGLLFWPMTAVGIALIAIGVMLVGMGYMMVDIAKQMAAMAKAMGQVVAAQVGTVQGDVVNYCTDQALEGTATKDCAAPESVTNSDDFDSYTQSALETQKHIADDTPILEGQ